MVAPAKAPVMQATAGLRKVRFARSDSNKGSSSGARIGYVYIPEFDSVGLVAVFNKNQQDNFTAAQKKVIREAISQFKLWLEKTEGKRNE